jgi:signal transduction histidine kinase
VTLRRDQQRRVVAGVAAGLARRLAVDPLLVRVAFIAVTVATGGAGLVVYGAAWAFMPAEEGGEVRGWRIRTGRAAVEVALGTGLLVLCALLTLRATGLWFSDAVVWPVVLSVSGGALLWRAQRERAPAPPRPDAVAVPPPAPAASEAGRVSRIGLGLALVIAAGYVFLTATGVGTARDVALGAVVVGAALAVVFGPWFLRERAERIRSQERAEVAAHLHDSVLQTLALVQKRADDPGAVAALARRQERELRAWLRGDDATPDRLAAALEAAAGEVESEHAAKVDLVTVGDRPLDDATAALVAAAREAMVNAAKHGGGVPVSVYVEANGGHVRAWVRDRGPGFDPGAVPPDRHGLRDSIHARMERHGGSARVVSAPGLGTEVELSL